jgi:hypothetical protein
MTMSDLTSVTNQWCEKTVKQHVDLHKNKILSWECNRGNVILVQADNVNQSQNNYLYVKNRFCSVSLKIFHIIYRMI